MKLNKRSITAAVAADDRYYLWDDEIKGFGLLVLPSGIRSYFFRYRSPEGRERRITIGKTTDMMPAQARAIADKYRAAVKAGGDPVQNRVELKAAPTFAEVLDAYLDSATFAEKAASTQKIDRGRIERHLKPLLGRRHVHLATSDDIRRAFAAIRDGKTATEIKTGPRGRARVTGGRGAARMAIDLLRAALNWAIEEKRIADNPAADIKTGGSGSRDTILEDASDYGRLFETLDIMERELRIRPEAADAIRLIALVGCRRGEAAGLRWRHVDLKRGQIVLDVQSHKTGKSTNKPKIITLPAVAQAILAKQPEGAPNDFVFRPARGAGGAMSLSKVWRKVRAEANLPAGIGLHGLRHSVASHLAMAGAEAPQIMTALGHRQLSTVTRYIHFAQKARAALAEHAASVAMAGLAAASKKQGKVLGMKGRRG